MLTRDAASDDPAGGDLGADDLISALEVIEQQPLESRADSYTALVEVLARQLESAPPE